MATDRYQGLRDALAAGPTEGPWAYEPHGDTDDYGVGVLWDEHDQPQRGRCEAGAMFVVDPVVPELRGQTNAAYIAAANPAAIRALLADYDAAVAERDALSEALAQYSNPFNWDEDEHGVRRCWREPGSSTPGAYNGFELARAALATPEAGPLPE